MAIIIKFPSKDGQRLKAIEKEILAINLPSDVDREKWEKEAVPAIANLCRYPDYKGSITVNLNSDEDEKPFQEQLISMLKSYAWETQQPLLKEVIMLRMQLCKNT